MPGTWWDKTRTGGKTGFDKVWGWADKLGAPVNKLSNKLGSEAFWPTTLDKESDKAARILRSFCKDGFYQEEKTQTAEGPTAKQRVLKKIPPEVIRNAKGLAIFTTMRTGLWVSGAGGSGILVGRQEDGSWSPPSGILLHTAGLGFLVGVDIYDCVVVINTQKGLDAFSKLRCTLGGEVSAVAGPVGAGGVLETEVHKRQAPIFTYLKSRGFYAGVQIDGTVVIERTDENERFYGQRIPVADILAGKVRHVPSECRMLHETIRAAQGDSDVDEAVLPSEPPPGDYELEASHHIFGVPDKEDPDPYGVLALEKEGMSIREAGTQKRASWEQFSFTPSPSSPIYSTFSRQSLDRDSGMVMKSSRPSSWKTSPSQVVGEAADSTDMKRASSLRTMTDMSTQTDFVEPTSPGRSSTRGSMLNGRQSSMEEIPEDSVAATSPNSASLRTKGSGSGLSSHRSSIRQQASRSNSPPLPKSPPQLPPRQSLQIDTEALEAHSGAEASDADDDDHDDDDDEEEMEVHIEEPVVHSVRKATTPQFISRARLVEVPQRVPPRLPPRNPNRRGPVLVNAETGAEQSDDAASATTPLESPESQRLAPLSPNKEDATSGKLSDIEVTPGEERNPWDNIMHKRNESRESVDMPGTFHSLPATPDETREEVKV